MRMRKYMQGVTLMELLIVVVVLGILSVIAYPQYQQYAARAKRTEAKAALLQIATNQERFPVDEPGGVTSTCTSLPVPASVPTRAKSSRFSL